MTKLIGQRFGLVVVVPLLWAGCSGAAAQPKPPDRASQAPLIIEEVLRYQVHQFASKGGEAEAFCVAVREDTVLVDPSPAMMARLNSKQLQPQSKCTATKTLIAGPIEWSRDDEVRVRGGYLRATEGETRLAYRVGRESGRWEPLGPIISWDPL